MAVAFKQQGIASSAGATTTVAVSLGAAPTAGNLLLFCMGGDKNTGALTLSGFTQLYELLSTSVSLYYYWKVSDGTETTINPSWATSSAAGNMAWYAEYEDTAVSGSSWQVSASASHITDEVITASWATGTTGTISDAGLGVAVATIDSSQSWTSATTWTNSYVSRYDGTGGGGRGAVFVAEHAETAGGTTSSTFGYTGTSDQVSAAIGVWTKLAGAAGGAAFTPRPLLPLMFKGRRLGRLVGFPLLDRPPGAVGAATIPQALTATTVLATALMQRQTNKGVTATAVADTGSIAKQISKPLTATSVAVTASLVAMKVILKALTASAVIVTASIVKQVNKSLSATAVVVTASLAKQVNKTLTATAVVVTATLSAIRVFLKTLTATSVVVTASVVRQIGKPLVASSVAVTGSLVKQVGKLVRATNVVVTGALTALRVFLKTLTATTVVVSSTMVRQVGKPLAVTVSLSATIAKRITKTLSAAVSLTASLVATFVGQVIGPFAASVAVADLANQGITVSDLSAVAASASDAPGIVATASEGSTPAVTSSELAGAAVRADELVP